MSEELERCYVAAMRILAHRFNSEAELRRKLAVKKFERAVVDATLERLRGEKWLDDERFAGALVRTRVARNVGKKRIRRDLHAAGVSRDSAESAITQNLDAEQELEALRALCAKRVRMLVRRHGEDVLTTAEGRNKLAVYLLNQGYDAALVREAVKEIRVAYHQSDS